MLDEVGLFDPLLFAYYEDTDLSWRARRRGWSVLAVGDAVIHHAFGGTAGSRASGFFFLDRRNWILTSLRNASPDLRRVVLGAARTQALRSVRANVLGRIRRGWRPTFRLTAMWARIWLGVLAVLPRRGPSAGPPVGAVATNRVRSVFQPAPRPRQPVHRAGGPRLVYVDVTDTLTSGWHAGIQRVVAGLVTALVSADPRIELVPIVWSRPHRRFRRTTSAEWCRLLAPAPPSGVSAEDVPDESGQARQAVASVLRGSRLVEVVREVRRVVARVRTPSDERTLMLDDLESQAVLLELDAVWNQREPDRSDLIAHLRGRGVAVVPFIHDLLPVEHPEWFVPPLVEAFEGTVLAQLEGAELVLVGSSATERSVLELCRSRGWLPPRVAHIPLGAEVSPTTGPGGAPPLPEVLRGRRYALAVGTVEPRKNQERIVEAFELLEQRGERDDLALAVVGRQGWQAEVVADRLRSDAARASGVYWLEGVGDAELAALYAGARLVLAPSYSEGFGLTAVEAARARVPVVASPGGAPGLGPDRLARIVDPDDADAWAEAIRQIALDDEVHTRALERLAGYEPPSWCDSATRTAAHLVEFHGTP
jgi:glycosyltransferase involved in cell wall biosynthesis